MTDQLLVCAGRAVPDVEDRVRRYCGLEWSAGIPGSVGGAVVSNAGAHGGCVADTLRRVFLLDGQAETGWVEAVCDAVESPRPAHAGSS